MFILTWQVSCLTTSSLLWFMDLTFQVPIQYCYLQHWILLFITRHIHSWVSYSLWPTYFIHSGAMGNSPLLFPSSLLDNFRPGDSSFGVISLWPVIQFLRFSQQVYWGCLLPAVNHVLSELSTMTCPSWVALHGMAHSFIELHKPLHHKKVLIHEGGGNH